MTRSALWLFVVLLLSPLPVYARLVINEIYYDAPGEDSGNEWVEIYNPDDHSYDVTGWKFTEGGSNHNLTLLQATAGLQPGDYAIIADNGTLFIQNHPQFTGTVFDSSFSLSNTGESISLLDSYLNPIDQVTYSASWGGGEDYSLERISARGDSNDPGNWGQGPAGGSPGRINTLSSAPTPTVSPAPEITSLPEPSITPVPTPTSGISPSPPPGTGYGIFPRPPLLPKTPIFPGKSILLSNPVFQFIFSRLLTAFR